MRDRIVWALVGCVFGSLGIAACATTAKQVALHSSHVGTRYARQTAYFAACGTICAEEQTTASIRHEVIRDEATLMSMGPAESCIDIVVRTASGHDEPFDQLEPTCLVDGAQAPTLVEREVVSVVDYDYTGQVETLRAEAVTQDSFLGLSISEPQDMVFRVIEREGRICCGAAARGSVELKMRNRHFDVGAAPGRLRFTWNVSQ